MAGERASSEATQPELPRSGEHQTTTERMVGRGSASTKWESGRGSNLWIGKDSQYEQLVSRRDRLLKLSVSAQAAADVRCH